MDKTTVGLVAVLASMGLQGLLLPLLRRHVVDVPGRRSSHCLPTARGGGVAVVGGLLLAVAAGGLVGLPVPWAVVAGLGACALLGLADDVRSVGVVIRLVAQLGSALCLALWVVWSQTDLRGPILIAVIAAAAVWVIGFTNAFNFMDGINGISAFNAVVAGVWYAYVGWQWQVGEVATLGLAVAGAAAGFLPWNVPRARVFLGDVGSYALGSCLAGLALWAFVAGVPLWTAAAPLTLYVVDTGWALARRMVSRRQWWEPHREHVYQRLVDGGWSHLQAASLSGAAAVGACAIAIVTDQVGIVMGLLLIGIAAGCYLLLPSTVLGIGAAAGVARSLEMPTPAEPVAGRRRADTVYPEDLRTGTRAALWSSAQTEPPARVGST